VGLLFASPCWFGAAQDWLTRRPLTAQVFDALHLPAVALVYLWSGMPGAGEGSWSALPYGITIQWLSFFAIVGLVIQHKTSRSREDTKGA